MACIDSQTAKTANQGGEVGYDGGKRANGRKRHIVTDVLGLLIMVTVTTASLHDAVAAEPMLRQLDKLQPTLELVHADKGYRGHLVDVVTDELSLDIRITSKPIGEKGVRPLHQRWVVERSFAWFNRYRRLSRDVERTTDSSETMIKISQIQMMLTRLEPKKDKKKPQYKYRRNKDLHS